MARALNPAISAAESDTHANGLGAGAAFWRWFIGAFLGLFLVTGSWAMANPLGAAPDEGAHTVTAYATAHGDVGNIYPTVPRMYVELGNRDSLTLLCFHTAWSVSADCQDWGAATADGMVTADTQFGTYNPVYYFLVGLPSIILDGQPALYAMRLTSALLFSVLAGAAIALAATRERGALAVGGLVAALTPTVFLLGGTVNVNAIEIAAALLVWSGMLALFEPEMSIKRQDLVISAATVGLISLTITRLLSPLWLVAIVLAVVTIQHGWKRLWSLVVTSRRFQAHLVAVLFGGLYAVWWTLTHPTKFIAVSGPVGSVALGLRETVWNLTVDFWERTFVQAIAVIDMLSLPIWAAAMLFAAVWGGMLAAAFIVTKDRVTRWVLVGVPVFGIVFPAFLEGFVWSGSGWQGRYGLPILMGAPILGALVLVERAGRRRASCGAVRAGLKGASVAVLVANLFTFVVNYQRFGAGWGQSWNPLAFAWQPPLGPVPWFVGVIVGSLILLRMVTRVGASDPRP